MPKYLLGFPTYDAVLFLERMPFPRALRRKLYGLSHFLLIGPSSRYGLPNPDYPIDGAHPTMSDEIPRLAAHGRIKVKPAIRSFAGSRVVFEDGSSVEADVVIAATGYHTRMPFLDASIAFGGDGRPRFFQNVFHQEHDTLFAAGLIQANGSIWRLADYQSQLITSYLVARRTKPEAAKLIDDRRRKGTLPKGHFVRSERHLLEANYFDYRRKVRALNRKLGDLATAPWPEPDRSSAKPVQSAGKLAPPHRHAAE